MRTSRRIADLIAAVYGRRYRLTPPRRPVAVEEHYPVSAVDGLFEQGRGFIKRHLLILLITGVVMVKLFLALTYYNRLISEESNMMAAYSNMNVMLQRRNDIGRNLITAIHYYTEYEERVYNEIVRVRSHQPQEDVPKAPAGEKPSANPTPNPEDKAAALAAATKALSAGAEMAAPFTRLMAVAEQYPDLKSETNFTLLMAAFVELEKDLAAQRIQFNASANTYTTTLRQFPSNIFAWIFRFKNFPYFDSSQEAKEFKISEQKY